MTMRSSPIGKRIHVIGNSASGKSTLAARLDRHAVPEDDHLQSEGDAGLSEEEVIVSDQLNTEEREILVKFKRDELKSASGADREMEIAPWAARNTFNKTRRVNLRVTEKRSS